MDTPLRVVDTREKPVSGSWLETEGPFDFGSWHQRGLTVYNASPAELWNMARCFEQARDLIHTARIDQSDLITHVGPPESAKTIYNHGLSKTDGYVKGVIRWR